MNANTRQLLIVQPLACQDPQIGRALWQLQDARARTLRALDNLNDTHLDSIPHGDSSIGTILYHIALIEADWLYTEVLQQELPSDIAALFPADARDAAGQLVQVTGQSFAQHLRRLAAVRTRLVEVFQAMATDDFLRSRALPAYDVTPEWVLHHLAQHEAEHRGQIGALRAALEQP